MDETWDCIVVGGGAAGLSAALVLGRARRRTLLIDAGAPSNAVAHGVGGLLGHDGRPPGDLYRAGRAELAAYPTVRVQFGEVVAGHRREGVFALELVDGTRRTADRVILATGMDYRIPDLPGLAERWGRSVFHCPFCHGWEVRDRPLGVLDRGATGVQRALLLRAWSDDVALLTDGPPDLTPDEARHLATAGVSVDERHVIGLCGPDDELTAIAFADGSERPCGGLLVPVSLHQRSGLAAQLGAATAEPGMVAADAVLVDAWSQTTVSGMAAAGDLSSGMPSVANAIAAGSNAAAAVVRSLLTEVRVVTAAATFWDDFYADGRNRWSGHVNQLLADEVGGLEPGAALDLGCGQGGDAIWLAGCGWQVTAVDVSASALSFAAAQAAAAGVADAIHWERHDLDVSFPVGQFDLVASCYLQSPVELGRAAILRAATAAVRPGGTLVVVGHAGPPSWTADAHGPAFPSADDVLADLELGTSWVVERYATVVQAMLDPDGAPASRPDGVVRVRRAAG